MELLKAAVASSPISTTTVILLTLTYANQPCRLMVPYLIVHAGNCHSTHKKVQTALSFEVFIFIHFLY